MELTKEIFIEGNLIEKSTIKLYYKGKFTRVYSNEVFIVFGYGLGWKNIKEQKMTWLNDCFYTEIQLEDFGILNFCFKNDFGTWDNNNGQDYSVNVVENTSNVENFLFENKNETEENNVEKIIETETITFNEIKVENSEKEKKFQEKENKKSFEELLDKDDSLETHEKENKDNLKVKKYTKEIKKEKFKRATDKKDKKNRHQKKIEKTKPTFKDSKAILDNEESLFEFVNNSKNKENKFTVDNIIEKEIKTTQKPKRKTKKEKSKANFKRYKRNKIRNIIRIISLLILISGIICLILYLLEKKEMENRTDNLLNTVEIDESQITESDDIAFEVTERMLQVRELNIQQPDLKGWVEIEGTNINYPLMQCYDNEFYMNHDYKREYSRWGSLFADKDYDWSIPSSNLLIYGHNFSDGVMLSDLLKYADKSFYEAHPVIKLTTPEEDAEYEIIAVFYSRLYYKSEKNVFRYYFFVNAEDEAAFNEFVFNAKAASIYDTGKTAEYGDQLLTLSTCEYSQEDGRFAVVARKIK